MKRYKKIFKTKYQKAKEKWFEENVLEFEIFYYDGRVNERIVEYNVCQGLSIEYPCFSAEGKTLFAEVIDMNASDIYFKYRLKFRRRDLYIDQLVLSETRKVQIC